MKLKLSFSTVNMWLNGDHDGAIDALVGKYREPTEAMQFGTFMHKQWEDEVNQTGHMPKLFGGKPLVEPVTEEYSRVVIFDWLCLSGVIDLQYRLPNGDLVLVDYKTGNSNANHYSNSLQVGCYKLLKPEAKLFIFKHFNQYTDETTSSIIHLTEDLKLRTLNTIIDVAYEIVDELVKRGMSDFDNWNKTSRKETK